MTTTTLTKVAVWVVVVILAGFLVVSLVGRQSHQAPTGDSQPVPSSTIPTTTATRSATPGTSAPPIAQPQDKSLEKRVLAFEQAYRELDPAVRREALRPYVTDKYLDELFPDGVQESEYLKSLRKGVTTTLDLGNAVVSIEDLDATTLEVFTQIVKTNTSDGVSQTMAVTHVTYWVLDNTGSWRVDAQATS